MRIADRVARSGPAEVINAASSVTTDLSALAAKVHRALLDKVDLSQAAQLGHEELRQHLKGVIDPFLVAERIRLPEREQAALLDLVLDELLGLGPLEALLKDPTISDVLVNGCERVFVERAGRLEMVNLRFRDDRHLTHIIQRIVARMGRRIDESSPMVDARLADGSRVNAVIPPLALDGPILCIRRFGRRPLRPEDLVRTGALSPAMLEYLKAAVSGRCSMLIAGGTGSGKTTLLNALSSFIPASERIITVEDAAELKLLQPHVVRLESRPSNLEGKGEVTIRDLVRNALRMRPDRIVVGECRGSEVLDMLQAMNTGHEGSLSTIHANSAEDVVGRLTTMMGMAGTVFTEDTMKTLISRAVHVIVHVSRLASGQRRITGIVEIAGLVDGEIQLHEVFGLREGQKSGPTHVQRGESTFEHVAEHMRGLAI